MADLGKPVRIKCLPALATQAGSRPWQLGTSTRIHEAEEIRGSISTFTYSSITLLINTIDSLFGIIIFS